MNYSNSATRLRRNAQERGAVVDTEFSYEIDKRGVHLRLRKQTTPVRRGLRRATALAAAALITLGSLCSAAPVIVPVQKDTDIYSFTGGPTGSVDDLDLLFDSASLEHQMRSFIQFDLSALIPAGLLAPGDIPLATLWLYTEAVNAPGTVALQDLTAAWTISATGEPGSIAWTNQPTAGTFQTSSNITTAATWYGFDVTPLVHAWIENPSSNYGVRLSLTGTGQVKFKSNDEANPALRPHLDVVPEPTTGAVAIMVGTLLLSRRRHKGERK